MNKSIFVNYLKLFNLTRHYSSLNKLKNVLYPTVLAKVNNNQKLSQKFPMSNSKKIKVRVAEITKLSSSVRGIKLYVDDNTFNFKPGQWVDFFIPEMKEIAGYSICCSPQKFSDTRFLELAIKYSTFPPTRWIHEQCYVNSEVEISLGGDFYLKDAFADISKNTINNECLNHTEEEEDRNIYRDILLIAGGVGINPIISIWQTLERLINKGNGSNINKVVLLYSARYEEDFIFKEQVINAVELNKNMFCHFFKTKENNNHHVSTIKNNQRIGFTAKQRIDKRQLEDTLRVHFSNNPSKIECYFCGPGPMIDYLENSLLDIGLSRNQLQFEKWW